MQRPGIGLWQGVLSAAVLTALLVLAHLWHPEFARGDRSTPTQPPNILFILTDDHRWDAMGCYGNDVVRTPNFDRLAREGARLDNFYIAAPLCCPSRAALLSGLYPHQNGVINNANMPDLPNGTLSIAQVLNRAGYVTGFVGKAHMGGDPRRWSFRETPIWLPAGASPHLDPLLMVDGKEKKVSGHITRIFADEALKFLDRHKSERWFLWLATTAPHTPYLKLPEFVYRQEDIKPPPGWPPAQPLNPNTDWTGYYSTVSMLDNEIGRVLDKLDALGLKDNTFVFLMGDNGFMMGSHRYPAKQVWFEESARMPALARWPGRIRPGTTTGALLDSVDVWPTLQEIGGTEGDKATAREGVSMIPALTSGKDVREAAFSEVERAPRFGGGFWQMARDRRYKYVRFESGVEHLYDMENDRHEQKDLVTDMGSKEALEKMRATLAKWQKSTAASSRGAGLQPGT